MLSLCIFGKPAGLQIEFLRFPKCTEISASHWDFYKVFIDLNDPYIILNETDTLYLVRRDPKHPEIVLYAAYRKVYEIGKTREGTWYGAGLLITSSGAPAIL
jgi:hypothetical protein